MVSTIGFLRAADGTISTIEPTGSESTEVHGINRNGAVTGFWSEGSERHGFIRSAKGNIKTFDVPGAIQTYVWSINDKGVVAGYFSDSQGYHGYVRIP